MKRNNIKSGIGVLIIMTLLLSSNLIAQNTGLDKEVVVDTQKYDSYHGTIMSADTDEPLAFVNIVVRDYNIATVSNSDGEFLLKIRKDIKAEAIQISHIGYKTKIVPVNSLKLNNNTIMMEMEIIALDAVHIYPSDARNLVRSMMASVRENYPHDPNIMSGFYRETIKKNRSYVGISEAAVKIYKAGYIQKRNDQVQIFKGRKSENVTKMDTLLFKLQGGPTTTLLFDVIKNPLQLLSSEYFDDYIYTLNSMTKINGKSHFIVDFEQKPKGDFPLYNGRYYIDASSLALTSAEFSLNLEDEDAASEMLIRRKPRGVTVTPRQVHYIAHFREQDGKWYFNYARGEMSFKVNWRKRLFNTNYTAMMEIAITDRADFEKGEIRPFRSHDVFKQRQFMSEEVANFVDIDFWGPHNTIEPDESIQSAIKKLQRKGHL